MSINVTVKGNPVNIKRGKLITGDSDYAKNEFDKRRRMRLEQVRHQSKEIAENVRNKVRREKERQLSDFEKQEERRLKNWQNRKLLELQEQYSESLKDLGLAHAQAAIEDTRDDIDEAYREELKEKAQKRGEEAAYKLRTEKNKENLKKAIPLQHKKISRGIEDVRSAMVSNIKRTPSKKRKKKAKTSINITTNATSNSDSISDDDINELDISSVEYDSPLSPSHHSEIRRKRTKSKSPSSSYDRSHVSSPVRNVEIKPKNVQNSHSSKRDRLKPGSPKRSKSPVKSIPKVQTVRYPVNTRISDRIKSRRFLLSPTYECEPFCKETEGDRFVVEAEPHICIDLDKPTNKTISSVTENQNQRTEHPSEESCCNYCKCQISKDQEQNSIPVKPTVSLKTLTKKSSDKSDKGDNKVQYYDHSNRFSKEYTSSKSNVQKIPEESLEVCPSSGSEREYVERIYKYDKDAEERGRKAMEKLNIHKDYEEILKKLPLLEKQERIASIGEDKPIFHMSDERLRWYEQRRQNHMENVYERHFPKTITIAPKKHVIEDEPFRTIDISGTTPSLNVAQWDVAKEDNGFTLTNDSGNILIETDVGSTSKEEYLKYLLERLKLQKEMLLREVADLPKNSNLNNIITDLEGLSRVSLAETEQKQGDEKIYPTPDTTTKTSEKKAAKQKRVRQPVLSSSNSSTSSTPPKKSKHKKYKLILQNTSTQTSPKTVVDRSDKENNQKDVSEKIPETTKDKKLPKLQKKGSARSLSSTRRSSDVMKSKVSRPTSPLKLFSAKDQASSPIVVDKKVEKTRPSIKERLSECKCSRTSCKCDDNADRELCEILIKIKDNDEPEIQIKSPTKRRKSITVRDITDKTSEGTERVTDGISRQKAKLASAKRVVKISDKASEKPMTWREHFSRNDTIGASTSTSYYSPPEFTKSSSSRKIQTESTYTGKSSQSKKKVDPKLVTYIRKLLTMSRTSVEELGVSTISDVSTPNVSMVETNNSENNSLNQLRNVIKYFNLNPEELAHYLNYSEDTEKTASSIDPNYSTASTVHSSGYEASKSRPNNFSSSLSPPSEQSQTHASKTSADSKLSSKTESNRTTPISQYDELAQLCQKRISNLSAMIEKVRLEKIQILSPVQSDKENSTQYLTLPSQLGAKSPTNSELEQAEIDRKMLEIDYELAEKLKGLTPQELMEHDEIRELDDVDRDLVERYRKLVGVQKKVYEKDGKTKEETRIRTAKVNGDKLKVKETIVSQTSPTLVAPDSIPFIPVLLDIPRLPKLPSNQESNRSITSNNQNDKIRKPPPAKGLLVAKKFNENITNIPHELSTIVEVDSQLSTKVRPSVSPKPASRLSSPTQTYETIKPVVVLPEFPTDWVSESKDDKKISDTSMPDIVAEISVNIEEILQKNVGVQIDENAKQAQSKRDADTMTKKEIEKDVPTYTVLTVGPELSTDSSTEKSEMENIEMMLKSMGMGWAVATLRKTQAALARSSSSSSFEAASKQQLSNTSSSDVTIRDLLGKKIFSNSTSSSFSQSITPNLTKVLSELSAIQGSGPSSETKHQRTSTPVQTTKSSDSKKGIFTAESEVSSVKLSDENYVTMPDTTGNNSD